VKLLKNTLKTSKRTHRFTRWDVIKMKGSGKIEYDPVFDNLKPREEVMREGIMSGKGHICPKRKSY
jgi:hypothetical protein